MIKSTEKVNSPDRTVTFTPDNGNKTKLLALASQATEMAMNMKVLGKTVCEMVQENSFGATVTFTNENGRKIKEKARENLCLSKEIPMMVPGKTICDMVKVSIPMPMAMCIWEIGNRIENMGKAR